MKEEEEKMKNSSKSVLKPYSKSALKKKNFKLKQRVKIYYVPHFRILQKCSSTNKKKNKKKKMMMIKPKVCEEEKKQEEEVASVSVFSDPLRRNTRIIRRIATITDTIITPFIQEEEEAANGIFIYFCVQGPHLYDLKWYKINPLKNTKSKFPTLSSICTMPTAGIPDEFNSIGLDSKLYAIGGYISEERSCYNFERVPSSKVFVCDLNSSAQHPVWEECCSMNSPKWHTALAVMEGQIYAIGSEDPSVEGFNPSLNKWTPLHSPDGNKHEPRVHSGVFRKDRDEIMILSKSYRDVYSFNVRSCSWTCFPKPFFKATGEDARSVAMGDVVFTFYRGQLYACDLSQPTPTEERVYGLEKYTKEIPPDFASFVGRLFYIGNGKLCLIWDVVSDYHYAEGVDMLIIRCVKFWVGKRNGKDCWEALVDRTDYYLVEGDDVVSYLAMQDS